VPTSRGFGRQGQRRKTSWEIGPQTGVDGASISLTSSASVLANGGAISSLDGLTLVRLRGSLNIFLTIAGAAGDGFHGAFGVGVVNENAFTAGIASVLTPITDESWDGWIYHRYFGIFAGGALAISTAADQQAQVNSNSACLHIEVDSKAMRKLDAKQTVYASLEIIELGAASVMEWSFNSRILVKLP